MNKHYIILNCTISLFMLRHVISRLRRQVHQEAYKIILFHTRLIFTPSCHILRKLPRSRQVYLHVHLILHNTTQHNTEQHSTTQKSQINQNTTNQILSKPRVNLPCAHASTRARDPPPPPLPPPATRPHTRTPGHTQTHAQARGAGTDEQARAPTHTHARARARSART